MRNVHWSITVSADTDKSVRMLLASHGGDLSRFVEQAVRSYIFDHTVREAKANNSDTSEAELAAIVDEAMKATSKIGI